MFDIVSWNADWMLWNTLLAWWGVLLIWATQRGRRGSVSAAIVAIGGLALAAGLDLIIGFSGPPDSILVALSLGGCAFVVIWIWRMRCGDQWARWLAYFGAVAFAPNAPYVFTDAYHYLQNVRTVGYELGPSVVGALVYGWFTVVAGTAWIVLLAYARALVRPRRWLAALAAISVIVASGIYIGRIVRVNSWELITDPGNVLDALSDIVTGPGPALFVALWSIAIAVIGWLGLRAADIAHARGVAPRRLVEACAWWGCAVLCIGWPLIQISEPWFAITGTNPDPLTSFAMVTLGFGLLVIALIRAGVQRWAAPRRLLIAVAATAAASFVVVVGSQAGRYAQHRGLCEYSPAGLELHGEACPDVVEFDLTD